MATAVRALPTTQEIDEAVNAAASNKKWARDAEALAEAKVKAMEAGLTADQVAQLMLPEIVESLAALLIGLGDGALTETLVLRELREMRIESAQQHTELIAAVQALGRRAAGPPPGTEVF